MTKEIRGNKAMRVSKVTWEKRERGAILDLKANKVMRDLKDQKEVMDQGVRQDRWAHWERRGKLVLLDLLAIPEVLGKRVTKDSKAQMVLLVPKEKE